MAKRQIINGNFQDALGTPLVFGYLTFRLNIDGVTGSNDQVAAGRIVTVDLDAFGNVDGTVLLWPNEQLTPDTVYFVKAYTAEGQLVWRSEISIPSGGSPYNLGGIASPSFLLLETGGYILLNSGGRIQLES